jgi:hypothetical protein
MPAVLEMKISKRSALSGLVVLAVLGVLPVSLHASSSDQNPNEAAQVVIRGRVVCSDASGAEGASDCAGGLIEVRAVDGKTFVVSSTDPMADMLSDSRVRSRDLQITAWVKSKNQVEVIKIQSVKQGKIYDLYYFCEVCNITAYAPGLCPCCRKDLEFREAPETRP